MNEHIFTDRNFPDHLRCQYMSFLRAHWWWFFQGEQRLRTTMWSADVEPTHVVLEESGILISYATLVSKMVKHADTSFHTAGVSAVFTYPAWRKQGYGQRLMNLASEHIRANDYDIAMLFCEPEIMEFYRKSGWLAMQSPTLTGDPTNPNSSADDDYPETRMMLFLSKHGQIHQSAFDHTPVYIGKQSW